MRYAKPQSKPYLYGYIIESWDDKTRKKVWDEITSIPKYKHYDYSSYSLACIIIENDWEKKYGIHGTPTRKNVTAPCNPFSIEFTYHDGLFYCRKAHVGIDLRKEKRATIMHALAIKKGDMIERFGKHFFAPLYEIQWPLKEKAQMNTEISKGLKEYWDTPIRIVRCYDIYGAMDPYGLVEVTDFL